jgi:malate synthase
MTTHFMRSYSLLAIKTCHRRQIHAIGGMSAFIPVRNDPAANERAFAQVRADKEREANDGHDGTWVAHPGMVALATEAFDAVMKTPNQIDKQRQDVDVSAADLLDFAKGPITEAGLRTNISVAIQYIEAWMGGQGAVPIFNLMEDAATAEISRSQVWQWVHSSRGALDDGRKITVALVRQLIGEELEKIKAQYGAEQFGQRRFGAAAELFDKLATSDEFVEFLTLPGYQYLD